MINEEIKRLQKLAGLLKEEEDIDLGADQGDEENLNPQSDYMQAKDLDPAEFVRRAKQLAEFELSEMLNRELIEGDYDNQICSFYYTDDDQYESDEEWMEGDRATIYKWIEDEVNDVLSLTSDSELEASVSEFESIPEMADSFIVYNYWIENPDHMNRELPENCGNDVGNMELVSVLAKQHHAGDATEYTAIYK